MENNKTQVTFMRVPVSLLLSVLENAWNDGADFVDIIGTPDEVQEEISIAVRPEYFSEEGDEEEDDNEQTDLNQLI
jgi:hypothetical protein